ncbi:hypothetical protein GCM10010129_27480 [Streptomyces fumigatiscleroticus]|nr:hypothetical protein GCM10010129_27480 [Streptomyces fumigatiscleroticus]
MDAVGTDTPASRATTASVGPAATLALPVRTIGNPPLRPAGGRGKSFDRRCFRGPDPAGQKALPTLGLPQHSGKTAESTDRAGQNFRNPERHRPGAAPPSPAGRCPGPAPAPADCPGQPSARALPPEYLRAMWCSGITGARAR